MALKTFHCFGNLPRELRYRIYLLATPPRAIHLKQFRVICNEWQLIHYEVRDWYDKSARILCGSPPRIPALLHTCKESRDELIKQGYELAFRSSTKGPRTWFNYKRDALFVPPCLIAVRYGGYYEYRVLDGTFFYYRMAKEDMERVRWIVGWPGWFKRLGPYVIFEGNPPVLMTSRQLPWWKSAIVRIRGMAKLLRRLPKLKRNTRAYRDIEGNQLPFLSTGQLAWWNEAIDSNSIMLPS